MFGNIGVMVTLCIYLIMLKKNSLLEKKLWVLVLMMTFVTVGVSILMGFQISLGATTKFINETVGDWTKRVIAQ